MDITGNIIKATESSKRRRRQMEKNIPDVYKFNSILYIGGNTKRLECLAGFYFRHYIIDILEIWEPNIKDLIEANKKHHIFRNIIKGDAREINKIDSINKATYDVIMWHHGPEHVTRDQASKVIKKLEKMAKEMVILGCPWGKYEQSAVYGNPYEEHKAFFKEPFFHTRDYAVHTGIRKKIRSSNILAWKRLKCHIWDCL